ncbi:hypothetical protein Btru_012452 [Bulinus truncatus]|nr:hypothetical protein Btru_012452 [Bulinus truncatus]
MPLLRKQPFQRRKYHGISTRREEVIFHCKITNEILEITMLFLRGLFSAIVWYGHAVTGRSGRVFIGETLEYISGNIRRACRVGVIPPSVTNTKSNGDVIVIDDSDDSNSTSESKSQKKKKMLD